MDEPRAGDGDLRDAGRLEAEDDAALQGRGRVVEMDDGAPGAAHALHGAPDQLVARLGQHLDGHVVGDQLLVDERADEIEIGLRGGGKADLDLLEAHAHEGVEEAALALRPHGLDQRLVAVAQIDAAPDGRLGDDISGPAPVRQIDGFEGAVLAAGLDLHVLLRCGAGRKGGTPVMDCLDLWDGGKDGCRAAANQARQPPLSRSRRAARKARRRRAEYRDFMLQ